jgi:hypothetical protein
MLQTLKYFNNTNSLLRKHTKSLFAIHYLKVEDAKELVLRVNAVAAKIVAYFVSSIISS